MIDNLGGRLGSFDRLEKELAPGSRWSRFDRAIGVGRVLRRTTAQRAPGAGAAGAARARSSLKRRK